MSKNPLRFRPSSRLLGTLSDWLEISAACLCCVVTASAVADTPKIEEIIVSARKFEERLQDTPVTVNVFTSRDIERQGLTDAKDLLGRVPGLSVSGTQRGVSNYTIRGVTSSINDSKGAPSRTVAIFLDDLPITTPDNGLAGAFDAVFFDIDRVEVLKGPQGTLYGGAAMGGAIKYVSARPDPSRFLVKTAAGMGFTHEGAPSYNAEAVVNVPLVDDRLAFRGGISYRHEGGFIDNIANGEIEDTSKSSEPFPTYVPLVRPSLSTYNEKNYNDNNTLVARTSLLWEPDPTLTVRPAFIYQNYKQDSSSVFFPNMGDLKSSYRLPQKTDDKGTYYSLDVAKALGPVELTSLTSYFDRKSLWNRDYSFFIGGLVPPAFNLTSEVFYASKSGIFNQEFRIGSAADSASRVRWLLGAFYSEMDFDVSYPAYTYGGTPLFGTELVAYSEFSSRLDQKAIFGEVNYALTDTLEFIAGARLFQFKQGTEGFVDGPFNSGFKASSSRHKEDGVTPKFGLTYKLKPDNLLFLTAAKGFRPGGSTADKKAIIEATPRCSPDLDAFGIDEVPASYESDSLWTYELGSKNQFMNGKVRLNASAFYTRWKGIQQSVNLPSCGQGFISNAGEAEIKGIELETDLQVSPGLQVGGNATYTDAKIVDDFEGLTTAKKGDPILITPKWMASFYMSYSRPINDRWSLDLRGDYYYRGDYRKSYSKVQRVVFANGVAGSVPFAGQFQEGDDQTKISAILGSGTTNIRLYADNVFDERSLVGADYSFGSTNGSTSRPRTFGMEVRQQF